MNREANPEVDASGLRVELDPPGSSVSQTSIGSSSPESQGRLSLRLGLYILGGIVLSIVGYHLLSDQWKAYVTVLLIIVNMIV
jgi:hypothetical protein